MKKTNHESMIRATARGQLLGKYLTVAFAYLISDFTITAITQLFRMQLDPSKVTGLFIYSLVQVILILISGIFLVGQNRLYLNIARNKEFSAADIWYGFSHLADKALKMELVILLHIMLRSIPFIGILLIYLLTKSFLVGIAAIAFSIPTLLQAVLLQINYTCAYFLILEDPDATIPQLLQASTLLMKGHIGSFLKLMLSFTGLCVLSFLSLGLGFIWVSPYYRSCKANFYLGLLRERAKKE